MARLVNGALRAEAWFDSWVPVNGYTAEVSILQVIFSAKQIVAKNNYGQFCHVLRRYLDEFGKERVMFGTDAPLLERAASSRERVDIVGSLPQNSPKDCRFTEEEIAGLMDGNTRRLLAAIPEAPGSG